MAKTATQARAPRRTALAAAAHMAAGKITGGAFGEIMLKEIRQKAEQEVKAQVSLKDRLRELMTLDPEGHSEFRSTLEKRRTEMNDAAKALNQSLAEYREGNPIVASEYVMISMWLNLSLACGAGYQPNFDSAWTAITQGATAFKNSSGKPDPKLIKAREDLIKNDKIDDQKKAQQLVELDTAIRKSAEANAKQPDHTTRAGRPSQSLIDKMFALVKDQPLHEVEIARDWLIKHVENVKANAASARVKTPNQQAAASPTFKAPAKTTEKAEAKGEKRTARKAKRK